MKKKYYVYMHLYNNHPVYCGVGTVCKRGYDLRAINFTNRNERYLNFIKEVDKVNIDIQIIARFDDRQDALWLEEELHKVYTNLYSISDKEVIKRNAKINSKPVVQLTLDGKFVKEYSNSIIEGFDGSAITKCCRKELSSSKGYRWLFADEYYSGDYSFKEIKREMNCKDKKSVVLVYSDRIEKFNSIRECMRATDYKNVSNIAKGKYNHYSKKLDCYIYYEEEFLEMECGNLVA